MSSNSRQRPNCPEHGIIEKCVNDLTVDMKIIKNTLIGEDLRGGMVADVAELKGGMVQLRTDIRTRDESRTMTRGQRYTLYGTTITAVGGVGATIAEYLITHPHVAVALLHIHA